MYRINGRNTGEEWQLSGERRTYACTRAGRRQCPMSLRRERTYLFLSSFNEYFTPVYTHKICSLTPGITKALYTTLHNTSRHFTTLVGGKLHWEMKLSEILVYLGPFATPFNVTQHCYDTRKLNTFLVDHFPLKHCSVL